MDPLKIAQKRAVKYWYSDGLNELGFGALMLLLGVYFFLEGSLDANHPLRFILESGFVLVIVGGSVLIGKLVQTAKERLTYQRTGFVNYPRRKAPAWAQALMGVIIAGVMAALVANLAISSLDVERWLLAISGVLMAGVLMYMGLRSGVLRFLLLSLLILAIGGWITYTGVPGSKGYGLFYILAGLSVAISGACTLISYLHNHPIEAEQGNEP
jgi:hypothetical protein